MNSAGSANPTDWSSDEMQDRLRRRYSADTRFKWYGIGALSIALLALVILGISVLGTGIPGFQQTQINLRFYLDPGKFDVSDVSQAELSEDTLRGADYGGIVRQTLMREFPEAKGRRNVRALTGLVSSGARNQLREIVVADPTLIGSDVDMWVPAADDVDTFVKAGASSDVAEEYRRISDTQIEWVKALMARDQTRTVFSADFFSGGDSREPELAGVWGAVVGSVLTLFVTLLLSFPIGVAAAVYLEEFAPKNRWSDFIEVNINNLAAVPSIVYGLLGLAVFLNVFHLPRSAPIVGGMTLALMTLPTIIIAARVAITSVPPSIRDAATGLGASRVQVTMHHVLPLAMPGIMTGTIIGMARALGETAPLLMIGMVAFVVDIPTGVFDAATVLPVQVFLWADLPEPLFVEKTSACILVLLAFLLVMNAAAVWMRNRFEQKW